VGFAKYEKAPDNPARIRGRIAEGRFQIKIKIFVVSWVAWFEKVLHIRSKKPMIGSKAIPCGAGKHRIGQCEKCVKANLFSPRKSVSRRDPITRKAYLNLFSKTSTFLS